MKEESVVKFLYKELKLWFDDSKNLEKLFEEADKKFEEQIVDAYDKGQINLLKSSKEYFNKTYGNDEW